MDKSFNEVKGNCDYRIPARHPGLDHCEYHNDDCEESCCPHMGNSRTFQDNQVPLSQCPMCGEEVPPDQIEWARNNSFPEYAAGFAVGMLFTLAAFGAAIWYDYIDVTFTFLLK